MRTCIVGGGLAGALLAWRLARTVPGAEIDLVLGQRCRADATAASGGAVRGYETDPHQRRLAIDSLVELLASPTLRRWAGFREVPSVYLRPAAGDLAAQAAEIDAALPGSVALVSGAELSARGWAGVPAEAVAVREQRAGYLAPSRLRDAVLADGAAHRGVRLLPAACELVRAGPAADPRCRFTGSRERRYDRVVIAAGAWTGALLTRAGLPADGYRTKSIQYTIYHADGWRPPQFVDELLGLYGRPAAADGLLLGVPTDHWGVDPDQPPTTVAVHEKALRLARIRFPALRIGPARRIVGAADCYAAQPTLSLRPVPETGHRLFTFTGGAGGCVKTALAASRDAAIQLAEPGERPALVPLGPREGQP